MSTSAEAAGSEVPPLGEVLEFLRLLWALDHGLQLRSKRMERTLGVTGLQRLVIRIVGRLPGIPAGRLARILHIDPSTLTGVLRRLESKRILARRADPRDGRRALFRLTVKGRRIDARTVGTVESAVRSVLEALPATRLAGARAALAALADGLLRVT